MTVELTDHERTVLADKMGSAGAQVEAAVRLRAAGVHADLIRTVTSLAERHQDWTGEQILSSALKIVGKPRKRRWGSP